MEGKVGNPPGAEPYLSWQRSVFTEQPAAQYSKLVLTLIRIRKCQLAESAGSLGPPQASCSREIRPPSPVMLYCCVSKEEDTTSLARRGRGPT